jgi:hypothetical protein
VIVTETLTVTLEIFVIVRKSVYGTSPPSTRMSSKVSSDGEILKVGFGLKTVDV